MAINTVVLAVVNRGKLRPCKLCGECNNPVASPHLTTREGVFYRGSEEIEDPFSHFPNWHEKKYQPTGIKGAWCVYRDGIFVEWFSTEAIAWMCYRRENTNRMI